MINPCYLTAAQQAALANTFPGSWPARAIISGRPALSLLVHVIPGEAPESIELVTPGVVQLRKPGNVVVEEMCPLGRLWDQLWVQEEMEIREVVPGKSVRVVYKADEQTRLIYLDEGARSWKACESLLTPTIEWARPDRLFIREISVIRLGAINEDQAARAGAPAAEVCKGSRLPTRSHVEGFKNQFDDAVGKLGAFAGASRRAVWLVGVERQFED